MSSSRVCWSGQWWWSVTLLFSPVTQGEVLPSDFLGEVLPSDFLGEVFPSESMRSSPQWLFQSRVCRRSSSCRLQAGWGKHTWSHGSPGSRFVATAKKWRKNFGVCIKKAVTNDWIYMDGWYRAHEEPSAILSLVHQWPPTVALWSFDRNFNFPMISCSNSPRKNLSFLRHIQRRGKTHELSSCDLRRSFFRTRLVWQLTWTYTLCTIFNPNPDDSEFCQICQNDNVPDVTNMSWQLSLSMTGTETWWRMFGTPPPDHVYQWAWSNYADTEDDNDRVKTWTSTILESTVIMMTTVTTMATMKMTTNTHHTQVFPSQWRYPRHPGTSHCCPWWLWWWWLLWNW